MRVLRGIAGACALTGLALAAAWSWRIGWADYHVRKETIAGTEEALRWVPGDAGYHYRLALLTAERDPAASVAALERVVARDPFDARAWIALGLDREDEGNFAEAERCLQRAATEDRRYLPRWTLANFYLRRGDAPRFWEWARSAAEMIYGDGFALFRLCERMDSGDLIHRLDIRRPEVRSSYVQYLLQEGRLEAIMPGLRRLIEAGREADTPLLEAACDRLLAAGRAEDALAMWNALAAAHRIPFHPLTSDVGDIVTNGRFATPPSSSGFDWRLAPVDGISAAREEQSGGLRLTFSGEQPENCELLAQFLRVRENQEYDLAFRYRTAEIPPAAGLAWRVLDGNGNELAVSGSLSAEDEREDHVRFHTPGGSRLARLTLAYRRAPGTTRITGYILLWEVGARAAAQLASGGLARSRVR